MGIYLSLFIFGSLLFLTARRWPAFFIHRPVTLGMVVCGIVLFGVAALVKLPVELMPNVSYGNVTVFIDVRGGMPPPEVERLVTKPVEEGMGSVAHLRNIVSTSKKERSIVTLEFEPGTDMDLAAMEVREKFLRVKPNLPREIEKPIIARYEESDAPIYIAALTSEKLSPEDLRQFVDTDIKEKLLRLDGVANVEVGGGRERKIIVDIDRNRLAAVNLPIKKVVGVLEQNNLNLKTGEVSASPVLEFGVRTVGAFRSLEDINNMTLGIAPNGGRIRVKDVAEVKDSFLEWESYSRLNAQAAVTLYIQKESTANTVRVAGLVEKELTSFQSRLPETVNLVTISNQKRSILSAVKSVQLTLLFGAVLVLLVLPIFLSKTRLTRTIVGGTLVALLLALAISGLMKLGLTTLTWALIPILLGLISLALVRLDMRTSFVVGASIPISIMMTLAFMFMEKVSINVMTLSGLILGIGLLVDNAVVVMEAYDRIVSENKHLSLSEAMLQATHERLGPMMAGTLTIIAVFLPFSLLQKQTQLLFMGLSFVVTASLLSSLFISIALVPVLGRLIDPRDIRITKGDHWLSTKWRDIGNHVHYFRQKQPLKYLWSVFNHEPPLTRRAGWTGGVLFLVATGLIVFLTPASLIQSAFIAVTLLMVATGILMVLNFSKALEWCLKHRPLVLGSALGLFGFASILFLFHLPKDFLSSAEQNEFVIFVELDSGVRLDISNKVVEEVELAVREFAPTQEAIKNVSSKIEGWSSKIFVTLNDRTKRDITSQRVIDLLRPQVEQVVNKYGKEYKAFSYFSEPRSGKEIFVEIFGTDYDQMAKIAMDLAARMGKVPGFSDVKIRYRPGRPQLSLFVDPGRIALFGIDTKEVAETLHAQMRGLRATTFFDETSEIETVVRVRPDQHESIDSMKNLLFMLPSGELAPLAHLADIKADLSPSEIWHRNKARMIQVSGNLGSMSLERAAGSVKNILKQMSFPLDYYADIGGQYEDMMAAAKDFWVALSLTLFLVFLVMACQFESLAKPFLIMGTVLLSTIGAVAALSLTGTPVTMGVSIGLLMLGGIVVNNGIMLMDKISTLKAAHPDWSSTQIAVQAGINRIRPIFMTASTTVLGLMPMALDNSESAVLWSPLAITVAGGLVTAAILTLFVIPCLYVQYEIIREKWGFTVQQWFRNTFEWRALVHRWEARFR